MLTHRMIEDELRAEHYKHCRKRNRDEDSLEESRIVRLKQTTCDWFDTCPHCGCILSSRVNKSHVPRSRMTRFNYIAIHDNHCAALSVPAFQGCASWSRSLLKTYHQFGFSERWLVRLFSHLPEDLDEALRDAHSAVWALIAHARKQAQNSAYNQVNDLVAKFAKTPPQKEEPWLYAGEGMEDDEMLVYEDADVSVVRYTFEPDATSQGMFNRRTEAFVNKKTCSMFGMHPEELLARIGCNDMPEHLCEVDHLLMIIENMWSVLQQKTVQYYRILSGDDLQRSMLMERCVTRRFDRRGLLWQITVLCRPLNPDEYDRLCLACEPTARPATNSMPLEPSAGRGERSTPSRAGGGIESQPDAQANANAQAQRRRWVSLRRELGDRRSGREILAGTAQDRAETMDRLRQSAVGRTMLTNLAVVVRDLFRPAIAAARRLEGQ